MHLPNLHTTPKGLLIEIFFRKALHKYPSNVIKNGILHGESRFKAAPKLSTFFDSPTRVSGVLTKINIILFIHF